MAFGDTVQSNAKKVETAASSITIVLGSTPTDGNLLVFTVGARNNPGFDTPSGWSLAEFLTNPSHDQVLFYKIASSDSTSHTVNLASGSETQNGVLAEYEGPFESSPLDVTAEDASGTDGVETQSTGTTATTAQADELAVAGLFVINNAGTSSGGWTQSFVEVNAVWTASGNGKIQSAQSSLLLSSTQTVETTGGSWEPSRRAGATVATFKKAVVAATTPFDLIAKKTGTVPDAPLRISASHLIRSEVVVLPPVKLLPLHTGTEVELPRPPQSTLIRPEVISPLTALPSDHLVHLTGTTPEIPLPPQTILVQPEVIPSLTALPLNRLVHHTGTALEIPRPPETVLSQPEVISPLTALPPSQLLHRTGTDLELAPPPVTILTQPDVVVIPVIPIPQVHHTGTALEVPPPPVTILVRPLVIPPLTALPPEHLILRTGTAPELPLPLVSVFTRPDFIPLPVITLPGFLRTGTALIIPPPLITRFVATVFLPIVAQPGSETGRSSGTLAADRGIDLGTSTTGQSPVSAKTGKSPSSL